MKSFKEYLNEAKIDGKNRIELESIAGGITVYASESGYFGNDDQSWFEIKGYSYSPEPIFYKDIPAEFENWLNRLKEHFPDGIKLKHFTYTKNK